jgi:hypothetical protein
MRMMKNTAPTWAVGYTINGAQEVILEIRAETAGSVSHPLGVVLRSAFITLQPR